MSDIANKGESTGRFKDGMGGGAGRQEKNQEVSCVVLVPKWPWDTNQSQPPAAPT